jgi:transposase
MTEAQDMAAVVIGIDPHKQTHQAVALDEREGELARLEVRATKTQVDRLVRWAAPFEERTWAIESAGGLGYLLAQQLVDAGEHVVDVPPTLASRVRLLGSGKSNKNDPNDARSVAIAAMRSPGLATVEPADHRVVLRILAKRNGDLGRERNRVANRLHALLCELVPAGITKEIRASAAQAVLDGVVPTSPASSARLAMALELLDDVRRLDAQLAESKRRIADAVAASKTSLTDVFGVGPVIAAMCIGFTGDVRRFATSDRFAAYTGTAPREVSSGGHQVFRLSRRGNRRLNHAIHMAAVSQLRHAHSPGRAFYDRKLAEGKSRKVALRALKRRISDVIYRQLLVDAERVM